MSRRSDDKLKMIYETVKRFRAIKEQDAGDNPKFTEYVKEAINKMHNEIEIELDHKFGKSASKAAKVQSRNPVKSEEG